MGSTPELSSLFALQGVRSPGCPGTAEMCAVSVTPRPPMSLRPASIPGMVCESLEGSGPACLQEPEGVGCCDCPGSPGSAGFPPGVQ